MPAGGTTPVEVSAPISGLSPHTIYHYRIVASNAGGSSVGADQTFTTAGVAGRTEPSGGKPAPPANTPGQPAASPAQATPSYTRAAHPLLAMPRLLSAVLSASPAGECTRIPSCPAGFERCARC